MNHMKFYIIINKAANGRLPCLLKRESLCTNARKMKAKKIEYKLENDQWTRFICIQPNLSDFPMMEVEVGFTL